MGFAAITPSMPSRFTIGSSRANRISFRRSPGRAHADREARDPQAGDQRAAVYVLKMGQPVRIRDLAEQLGAVGEDGLCRHHAVDAFEVHHRLVASEQDLVQIRRPATSAPRSTC
jgi:hypothetical protein